VSLSAVPYYPIICKFLFAIIAWEKSQYISTLADCKVSHNAVIYLNSLELLSWLVLGGKYIMGLIVGEFCADFQTVKTTMKGQVCVVKCCPVLPKYMQNFLCDYSMGKVTVH
jgi:hypothetical protein